MKNKNNVSKIFGTITIILLVISSFTFIAIGDFTKNNYMIKKESGNQPLFFAEIEFYLYVGKGCSCDPIENVKIIAHGLDTDYNDTNITNDDGYCVLELEINSNYRVIIEDTYQEFHPVIFDFLVVDEQIFTFHLQEVDDSVSLTSQLFINIFERIRTLSNH